MKHRKQSNNKRHGWIEGLAMTVGKCTILLARDRHARAARLRASHGLLALPRSRPSFVEKDTHIHPRTGISCTTKHHALSSPFETTAPMDASRLTTSGLLSVLRCAEPTGTAVGAARDKFPSVWINPVPKCWRRESSSSTALRAAVKGGA